MASCAHGLKATVCVVDSKNSGFQCASESQKEGFYLPFKKGESLLCSSPSATEAFLKACKVHQVLGITQCSYRISSKVFLCTDPLGSQKTEVPEGVENYFCLSPKDMKRVVERCKKKNELTL